jgi:hypothetical protein
MPVSASDLPESVKRKILSQIRDHLGPSEYRKMVRALGQDGLIEMALGQLEDQAEEAKKQKRRRAWQRWAWFAIAAIVLLAGVGARSQIWSQFLFFGLLTLGAAAIWAYLIWYIPSALEHSGCEGLVYIGLNLWYLFIPGILATLAVLWFVLSGDPESARALICKGEHTLWGCKASTPTP